MIRARIPIMSNAGKRTVLYLARSDLRVHDNECLKWAHDNGDHIIPLFSFQPQHFAKTHNFNFPRCAKHRTKFLLETVRDLRSHLKSLGSQLIVRQESIINAVRDVVELCSKSSSGVHSIVYQQEVATEETDDERKVNDFCKENNITVHTLWGSTLYHRDDIPYNMRSVPDTYTQFRKGVEERFSVRKLIVMPQSLKPLPPVPSGAKLGDIPTLTELGFEGSDEADSRSAFNFSGGESSALKRLKEYLWDTDSIAEYKETRNGLVGGNYSTKFSPWLANGSLSPRYIYHEVKKYENERTANTSTYWCIFELIWRDYFRFVTAKYGSRIFHLSGIKGKDIPWKQDSELIRKWTHGETGVPFVDANMKELLHTGWMSNRGRQNVASFLVKDLQVDWRVGAEWFESLLLDHDVCSNYGNWNYAAGIGNDPRQDRKFNMIKQALDYDVKGEFVKLWLPELRHLPSDKVHFPWTLSDHELHSHHVKLGEDYPHPMLVAPEWGRHTASKGGGKGTRGVGKGATRGIDFYFKSGIKK